MNEPSPPTFWLQEQLGFTIDKGVGRAGASLVCDERHLNPHGTVHGAVLFALLDTAMGAAAMSVLREGDICATIEIHTRFLSASFGGRLTAEVEVLKPGKRVIHLDGIVRDEDGKGVAKASGSFAVLPRPA